MILCVNKIILYIIGMSEALLMIRGMVSPRIENFLHYLTTKTFPKIIYVIILYKNIP